MSVSPYLQSYFASREWYLPAPKFDLGSLTAIERKNVNTILAFEARAKQGIRFSEG